MEIQAIALLSQLISVNNPSPTTPPAGYEGLYQTWSQWARTALGYAVDRIAKLEQRNVQLEALVEEARARLAALELNEVSDDAVDTTLINSIAQINARLDALESDHVTIMNNNNNSGY